MSWYVHVIPIGVTIVTVTDVNYSFQMWMKQSDDNDMTRTENMKMTTLRWQHFS